MVDFRRLKSFLFLDNFYSNLLASVIVFLVFLFFYVVDIEVGRDRVYFSVGNKAKMGGLRVWSCEIQFLAPKRNHFSHYKFFFFLILQIYQNNVILNQLSLIKTTSFG